MILGQVQLRETLQGQRETRSYFQCFLELTTSLSEAVGLPIRYSEIIVRQSRVGRAFHCGLKGDERVLLLALRQQHSAVIDSDDRIFRCLLSELSVQLRSFIAAIGDQVKLLHTLLDIKVLR